MRLNIYNAAKNMLIFLIPSFLLLLTQVSDAFSMKTAPISSDCPHVCWCKHHVLCITTASPSIGSLPTTVSILPHFLRTITLSYLSLCLLIQYFLNLNVHKNHLGVLWKSRLWFSRSGLTPKILHVWQALKK